MKPNASQDSRMVGDALPRREDRRFVTGAGRYVDDLVLPDQAYAVLVRSPHAHATIRAISTETAKASPGVLGVFTGQDVAADKVGGIPCGWLVKSKDGTNMVEPPHPMLVLDRVRCVGDQVAVVVAESKAAAREAAMLVEVDYDILPAVASIQAALSDGAQTVWDQAKNNVCFDWDLGDKTAVKAAMNRAHKVVELTVRQNRLIPNAIEPRAALGHYDAANDHYTLYTTSQNPHLIRLLMAAFVLGIPEHRLRVVADRKSVV